MTIRTFIDIAPSKEKKVCDNCNHFFKWGVSTGMCLNRKSCVPDKLDTQTCKKFEPKKDIK